MSFVQDDSTGTRWALSTDGIVSGFGDDGGMRIGIPTVATLRTLHVSNLGRDIWAFGDGATIVHTADGGRSWQHPEHSSLPPLWSFLSWLAAAALGYVAYSHRDAPATSDRVADRLVSDRPIEDPRHDLLGLHAIALTLSHFIRNENTEPPVSIAVTGAWGTGKSSVLALLDRDLRTRGLRPVAFNAWHHQQSQNFLAALYSAIAHEAVPRVFSLAGLEFRARLVIARSKRLATFYFVTAALLAGAGGYFAQRPEQLTIVADRASNLVDELEELLHLAEKGTAKGSTASHEHLADFAILAPLLSLVATGRRGLKAFGVKPEALVAPFALGASGAELKAAVTFQARFAVEFAEVTEALGDRRLVVMIDDLDRCEGANIVKMLEALNFLMTAGRCFVVLAISRRVIEDAVAKNVKDIVLEDADLPKDTPEADLKLAYANRYLEKLLNIEVAVPQMKPEALAKISSGTGAEVADSRLQALAELVPQAERVTAWVRRLAAAVVVAAFLTTAVVVGVMRARTDELNAATTTVEQMPQGGSGQPPPTGEQGQASQQTDKASQRALEPLLLPGVPAPVSLGSLVFACLLGGFFTARRLSQTLPLASRDAPWFTEAVEIWLPVLELKYQTPRAAKRFLNHVRFRAMRKRGEVLARDWKSPAMESAELWTDKKRVRAVRTLLERMWVPRGEPESPAGALAEADIVAECAKAAVGPTRDDKARLIVAEAAGRYASWFATKKPATATGGTGDKAT
jgi:hypothetical protein